MPGLTVADWSGGAQGALLGGRVAAEVTGISIDSRTVAPGEAFVAIRGPRQDGHAFVAAAGPGGPWPAWWRAPRRGAHAEFATVLVDETPLALQRLSAYHRRRHDLPVVGITGSNGKTTTKELTALALGEAFRVHKAAGSFNNQWGLPSPSSGLCSQHQAAVLELGMNAFGEIAALAQLALPRIGVVTTISAAHSEEWAPSRACRRPRASWWRPSRSRCGRPERRRSLVLALGRAGRGGGGHHFGQGPDSDLRLGPIEVVPAGGWCSPWRPARSTSRSACPLAGRHNAWNAAAAASVAHSLGVPLPGSPPPSSGRPR